MIKKLITDLAYDNITLSQALIRAKLIAHKINNEDFRLWIDNELNGYSSLDILPSYRIIPCELQAVINVPFEGRRTIPMETSALDTMFKGKFSLYEMNIFQSVSILEVNIQEAKSNTGYENIPQNIVKMFREMAHEPQLIEVHRIMQFSQLSHILNLTKQKLIDTLLKLDREFPNLINDYTMTKENSETVQSIITNNIYGNGNNVASGNNIEQTIYQNLIDYDKLKECGVEEQYIDELKDIEQEPNKKILKEKVLSWFSKVSAAVAARGLYDNIPIIMECIKSII
ncbi:MAG: hypothetical protein H6Q17_243 [Bacteroidetes bacterium]|nr:hypothetical protein [Bacteroidota bacterium]